MTELEKAIMSDDETEDIHTEDDLISDDDVYEEAEEYDAAADEEITEKAVASATEISYTEIEINADDEEDITVKELKKSTVEVERLKNEIKQENAPYLLQYFKDAKEYRDSFDDVISGPIKRSYRVAVSIPDEAGIIAKISGMFAKDGINLKNMGIVHNREFEEGVLRIEFYDEASLKRAISILRDENYTIFIR